MAAPGPLRAWSGETELFIHLPYQFRAVDALVTNFHLHRTTLRLLVAAFAGTELTYRAYQTAVEQRYRFYSYGDAMLILLPEVSGSIHAGRVAPSLADVADFSRAQRRLYFPQLR